MFFSHLKAALESITPIEAWTAHLGGLDHSLPCEYYKPPSSSMLDTTLGRNAEEGKKEKEQKRKKKEDELLIRLRTPGR